ncbi:MAG: hypothetical protein N2738_08335 [Thermodesulfovibrionales bacterium]|nr:hypothetical protein [Thermodesulfovibrionales bacterium]
MENEKILKTLVIEDLKNRYAKKYTEVIVNKESSPDIILSNHGLKIAAVCVETESSINEKSQALWKSIVDEGVKLILMVPNKSKAKVTSLLWDGNLMTQVSIGTYEINISSPV